MKTHRLLLAAVLAASASAARADISFDKSDLSKPGGTTAPSTKSASNAGTDAPAAPATPGEAAGSSAPSPEDARVAALKERFAQAKAVETGGNLREARTLFDGIIADAPDAKGSLLEAGLISMQLGEYQKAESYFDRLHAQVPDNAMVLELLIQSSQALKLDAKVEILIQQFRRLYAAGKTKPYFIREYIRLDDGTEIRITQFFDYHQPPNYAWVADLYDAQHNHQRQLSVNYDPEVTASMRKDPKLANAEQFLVVDNVMAGGRVTRLDVYQQFLALPDYGKARTVLLEIFAHALKPIDSAPVPQGAEPQGGDAQAAP